MPNYCDFEIKTKGTKKNVEAFYKVMNACYYYDDTKETCEVYVLKDKKTGELTSSYYGDDKIEERFEKLPCDKHLWRVFECYSDDIERDKILDDYKDDDVLSVYISGYCAWSVYSCMFDGPCTYQQDFKNRIYNKGTTVLDLSKDLNLQLEIFSEEPGCEFSEHFLIDRGKLLTKECVHYEEIYDEYTDEYTPRGGFRNSSDDSYEYII